MTISRQYLQSFHDSEFGTLSMDRAAGTAALRRRETMTCTVDGHVRMTND
jgi:hypothetical protein